MLNGSSKLINFRQKQDYLGETGCRIIERTADHSGKDQHSHLFKHACNENHKHIDRDRQ